MKRQAMAAAVFVSLSGGIAAAQTVIIEPEQRTRIREYLVEQSVPRVVVQERVRVGGTVPREVELREAPADWGPSVRRYRYYRTEGGIHFVDPESRRVVYDID